MRKIAIVIMVIMIGMFLYGKDKDKAVVKGDVYIGFNAANIDDYIGKIAEYSVAKDGVLPYVSMHLNVFARNYYFDVKGENEGRSNGQKYSMIFDAGRIFTDEFSYKKFLHRLDHDPLTNLDAKEGDIMVWSTDLAPGHEYRINYTEFENKAVLRSSNVEWLKLVANVRYENRKGAHQGMTLSKCFSCHITSMTRPVDETLTEVEPGIVIDKGKFGAEYHFLYRESSEDENYLTFTYLRAYHPLSHADIFYNRVSYDERDGALPVFEEPEIRKYKHTFKIRYDFNEDNRVSGAAIYSKIKNEDENLEITGRYYSARYTGVIKGVATLNMRFRYENIDNDDVFVDIKENEAVAGPQAGMTFSEAYPDFGEADFIRRSSLSREDTIFQADLSAPFGDGYFVRFGYEYKDIDRDYYGNDSTTHNKFSVYFRTDPRKSFYGRIRFKADFIDNPFTNYKAAIEEILGATPASNPFAAVQYWQLYDSRKANLTNQPSKVYDIDMRGTYKPREDVGMTLHYNYIYRDNDDLNYSEWEDKNHILGFDIYYIPNEKTVLSAGINYYTHKTNTLFTYPYFYG